MSNVNEPTPVAWVIYEPITKRHILSEVELQTKYLDDGTIAYSVSPVVFQSQSEAYAAERVREALEQAAQEANDWAMQYVEVDSSPHRVGDYIRALITKE